MASYTPNLNLYKKDPIADGNDFFNIKTMMNDNWDKIDDSVKAALDDIEDLQSEQVRIATGSYVGTGTYGASNPCSLTFPFVPRLLIISEGPISAGFLSVGGHMIWKGEQADSWSLTIRLTDKTLSWYTNEVGLDAEGQLNESGVTYRYFSLG